MNARYIVTSWTASAATEFDVVDTHASDEEQLVVVASFTNDPWNAWAHAEALNDMTKENK